MMCIITKEGHIINIKQALGNLDTHCSYSLKEIITKIASWQGIKPAYRKGGEAVNVRWFIIIDNINKSLLHPVFADTPKNRARVIIRISIKDVAYKIFLLNLYFVKNTR